MIKVNKAHMRYQMEYGQSRTIMSYSANHAPSNRRFGPLIIFNDDFIGPQDGIGMHPHKNIEIVTFMITEQNYHKDSTGTESHLIPGMVQVLSTGTGIVHEGMNPSETEEENHLQIWFEPDRLDTPPEHHEFAYDQVKMINRFLPIVSNRAWADEKVLPIHQDATIFVSKLEDGHALTFTQAAGRSMYVFNLEGELVLNGEALLERRDAAQITGLHQLSIIARKEAHFMLIDLP
ncbi:pirin family protein [Paenibacillus azoreducens]|uniref:pirin family protein n=1 Tax=Paenibacillus azoreducens TaxID=116718 RepID=UPI0039F60A05